MALTKQEILKRKRECEKKRRQRLREVEGAVDEENKKRRIRYALKKVAKSKSKRKESAQVIRERRLKWRINIL